MTTTTSGATGTRDTAARRPGFIAEIEGVRGIALTLVVLFHLFGHGRVSGGVDVFLLISGFLLTRSIVGRVERADGPFLRAHFARVLSRLVPAAVLVLVVTAVATVLIAPPTRWLALASETAASALYYENWQLIDSQLAYGAAGPAASPLQHFWSLSVQGQFFLVWPFVILALAWLSRRLGGGVARWVLLTAAVLSAASFAYAVVLGSQDQAVAYFNSFTRFWELGAGAVLALTAHRLVLSETVRVTASWLGLAMIVSSGFLIDGALAFPGPLALWPLGGAALIILASGAPTAHGPDRLLQWRPLRFLAEISYPLYLWHWPILVLYLEARDQQTVGLGGAAVVFTVSVVLAWLTQRLLAAPAVRIGRRLPATVAIAAFAAATVAVAAAAWVGAARIEQKRESDLVAAAASSPEHPGASAVADEPASEPIVDFVPTADSAEGDLASIYHRKPKCIQNWRSEPGMDEVLTCSDDTPSPTRTIVMSGGSHVEQWYPALKAVAEQEGWAVVVVDKDGCRLTQRGDDDDGLSEMCHRWNDKALPYIIGLHPDAVFTVATKTPEAEGAVEVAYPGQVGSWQKLAAAGIPVIAVRDTPRFPSSMPECILAHDGDARDCGRARSEIFASRSPVLDQPGVPESTVLLDLSDGFCTATTCHAVVGNVLAYRDADHMTATFAKTLAPQLRTALLSAAPWLF